MQYDKIARSYKAQSVQTASPGKLVLMLFDGCLRFTAAARKAFDEEEFTKRNEDINNNLIRAQNIVTELQSSLDMSVPRNEVCVQILFNGRYFCHDFVCRGLNVDYSVAVGSINRRVAPSQFDGCHLGKRRLDPVG